MSATIMTGMIIELNPRPNVKNSRLITKNTSIAYVRLVYPLRANAYNNGRKKRIAPKEAPSAIVRSATNPSGSIKYFTTEAFPGAIA